MERRDEREEIGEVEGRESERVRGKGWYKDTRIEIGDSIVAKLIKVKRRETKNG